MFSESILKRAQEREARSQEHKARFLAGEETALRDFCRTDPFAMQTKWVQDAIQKALFCDNRDILDNLFKGAGKGKKKSRITRMIDNLIIQDAVERVAMETGLPKSQPIKYNPDDEGEAPPETVFDIFFRIGSGYRGYFSSMVVVNPRTAYNRYQESKKQVPDIMIEDRTDGVIIRKGPYIIDLADYGLGNHKIIGVKEVLIPLDGSEQTLNVNAVFNVPRKSTILEDITRQMMAATASTT